jgi:hypothetical protein
MRRSVVVLAACLACAAWPAAAVADGDPPSDFLIQEGFDVYYPYTPQFTTAQKQALELLAQQAKAAGVPLKVAIVETDGDLGAVPQLFGKPQDYATFLAAEIKFAYTDTLLSVMPAGFGISTKKPALKAALAGLKPPGPNGTAAQIAQCTADAMVKVAAAGGATLAAPKLGDCADPKASGPDGGGGGSSNTLLFAGGGGAVVVVLALAGVLLARRRGRGSDAPA